VLFLTQQGLQKICTTGPFGNPIFESFENRTDSHPKSLKTQPLMMELKSPKELMGLKVASKPTQQFSGWREPSLLASLLLHCTCGSSNETKRKPFWVQCQCLAEFALLMLLSLVF